MAEPIQDSEHFIRCVTELGLRAVLLDLRGTLTRAPRNSNLARAAMSLGFPEELVRNADARTPGAVLDAFRQETQVFDWTLVSVLKFSDILREEGIYLGNAEIEIIHQIVRAEYLSHSAPLLCDSQLSNLIGTLAQHGIKTEIAADGISAYENAVFNRLFPETKRLGVRVHASDSIGVNKLSEKFYITLANLIQESPKNCLVVGDRIDKDILAGSQAGCKTLFVGNRDAPTSSGSPEPDWTVGDLVRICPIGRRYETSVLFGRFQPFHLEHLRFVRHAAARSNMITIGITNPFGENSEPSTNQRTNRQKNPLPFWLRKQLIETSLEADGFDLSRFSIIPCPLERNRLSQLFAAGTTAFVTSIEPWSDEKSQIITDAGLHTVNLPVGNKTISGTEIRSLILSRNPGWKSMVCAVSDYTILETLEAFVLNGHSSPH